METHLPNPGNPAFTSSTLVLETYQLTARFHRQSFFDRG